MGMTTWEKGLAQGEARGLRRAVRALLERKFGALNNAVLQRLEAWPVEKLEPLLLAIESANSLREVGLEDGGPPA
jgi:hypothetical protein